MVLEEEEAIRRVVGAISAQEGHHQEVIVVAIPGADGVATLPLAHREVQMEEP